MMASQQSHPHKCPVCPDTSFNGPSAWEQHKASDKHRRREARSTLPNPKAGVTPRQDVIFDEDAGVGVCYVCNNYSGEELKSRPERDAHVKRACHQSALASWTQERQGHVDAVAVATDAVRGLQVQKRVSQVPAAERISAEAPKDPVLELSKFLTLNPEKDQTNKYLCSLCKTTLSGEAPVKQHLVSAKHLKQEHNLSNPATTDTIPPTPASGNAPLSSKSLGIKDKSNHLSIAASPVSSRSASSGNRLSDDAFRNGTFKTEYEEIGKLGEGGYGQVFRVRHRLDMQEYAVKKVIINQSNFGQSLKEVRVLANISKEHKGIVRYNTCWLEQITQDSPGSSQQGSASSQSSGSSTFMLPTSDCMAGIGDYLFIAMQLCSTSLSDYLLTHSRDKERKKMLDFYRQIVDAVGFVHSKNMIHRDLKPANIFLTGDHIMIGDFGLVAGEGVIEDQGSHVGSDKLTRGKGTRLYMAPEQLLSSNYDHKVDIYPLGLIFVELLCPIGTIHEKIMTLEDVRNERIPGFITNNYPSDCPLIKGLINKKPSLRPEAKDILKMISMLAGRPGIMSDVTAPAALS